MKSFVKIFFCLMITWFLAPAAQAQFPAWGIILNNTSSAKAATDAAGNTYIFGEFSQFNANFPTLLPPFAFGQIDLYLAKYNPQGAQVWIQRLGGMQTDYAYDIKVDGNNNILVMGTTAAACTVGTLSHASPGLFIAKLNPDGDAIWLQNLHGTTGSSGFSDSRSMDVDSDGNIFVAVNGINLTSFGGMPVTHQNSFFVAKINGANGASLWLSEFNPIGGMHLTDLDISPAGKLSVTGWFQDKIEFGPSVLTGANVTINSAPFTGWGLPDDLFVAQLDSAGQVIWALEGLGPELADFGQSVTGDAFGNTYVTGIAGGAMTLGDKSINSPGTIFAKITPTGHVAWLQNVSPAAALGHSDVEITNQGAIFMTGTFATTSLSLGVLTLTSPDAGGTNTFVVEFDSDGTPLWGIATRQEQFDNYPTSISFDNAGNIFLCGYKDMGGQVVNAFTLGLPPVYLNGKGYFLIRINQGSTIAGTVFLDQNANGVLDAGETGLPAPVVVQESVSQRYSSTNTSGRFKMKRGIGNYNISLADLSPYYTLTSPAAGNYTGSITANGQLHLGRDFGLQPIPNQPDLEVFLTPVSVVRPGFPVVYNVAVRNPGTTTFPAVTVTLQADSGMVYNSSAPAATASGQVVTWSFSNLAPFGHQTMQASFTAPMLPLGSVVTTTAVAGPVAGDLTPANNSDTTHQIVIGAYDPNDKQVNHILLTPEMIQDGQTLDYTIRFQNMGTDTAFKVVIIDTLMHSHINPATVNVLTASHPYTWTLSGNGVLQVTFADILLPHKGIDEPGSQGFVRFRITPRSSLALYDQITNNAGIYFDFNEPVITNDAITIVEKTVAAPEEEANTWRIYPNPANEKVIIHADHAPDGAVDIALLNVVGREVLQTSATAGKEAFKQVLDVSDLPAGMYLLQIKTQHSLLSRQLIKQ